MRLEPIIVVSVFARILSVDLSVFAQKDIDELE